MKESYGEGLATQAGPESCVAPREGGGEALTGGSAGQVLSREIHFADDFVVGFEHRQEAEQFLADLRESFARFGLELHPDKTRLLPFGRKADREWRHRGGPKPGTFNFLGFTHSCGKTRKGWFTVLRQTMQAKLKE